MTLPAFGSEQFGGVQGAMLVVTDGSSDVAVPVMTIPTTGFGRVIAQDTARNRLFIETFDSHLAPSYWRLWVADPGLASIAPTAFRATAMHEYFYDEDTDTLFVFGFIEGQRQIAKIDLDTGLPTTIMSFPASGVWNDVWRIAAYDPDLNRLYVTGIVTPGPGESAEIALFAADLDSRTLTTSPYRTRETLRFVRRSSAGVLYAHVAQRVSSESQRIVRVEFATGAVTVVVPALPPEQVTPIVYSAARNTLYLRRFRDGQVFVADLVNGTYRATAFRSDYYIEFAPFPFVALVSVPLLGRAWTFALAGSLSVAGWFLLRRV